MDIHFRTAAGWPQDRAAVEQLTVEQARTFAGQCAVEPADPDSCLACYAYLWAQAQGTPAHGIPAPGGEPADPADEIATLRRLVRHMDRCVRRGGPANYTDFLDEQLAAAHRRATDA